MRATFAVAVLFTLGCHQGGLPATGGTATPVDLGLSPSVDAGTADFASPPHLASSCHDTMPNASTSLAGHALAYSWVANSSCDASALARIGLEDSDTFDYESPLQTWILATLPLTLGPQAVTVYTGLGADEHMADGTLDVTGFTHTEDGYYIDSVQGSIESPALQLSGSFAADHCAELDIACI